MADSFSVGDYRILSSMTVRDDIESGESYFMAEIKALKRILDTACECPVLCFVDEVLRGTNTIERIAASSKVLKALHGDGILCFAATHDLELTGLMSDDYDNYYFDETIEENDIIFNYTLKKGRAATRNAIKLLSVMGFPQNITDEAGNMAAEFEKTGIWRN